MLGLMLHLLFVTGVQIKREIVVLQCISLQGACDYVLYIRKFLPSDSLAFTKSLPFL